jgi:hypothetical protein
VELFGDGVEAAVGDLGVAADVADAVPARKATCFSLVGALWQPSFMGTGGDAGTGAASATEPVTDAATPALRKCLRFICDLSLSCPVLNAYARFWVGTRYDTILRQVYMGARGVELGGSLARRRWEGQ